MALLSALWFSVLLLQRFGLHLSSGSETVSCPAVAGVPGSSGHNGLPERDGRDGLPGPKEDKGDMDISTKVAFTATLSTLTNGFRNIGPYSKRQTLVYENVLTNIGNAYDPKSGIFTAPVKGVYFFTFVLFNPNKHATGLSLVKNGEHIVSASDNQPGADTEDTAGNSVSLLLEKEDQVHLELLENRKVYTDKWRRNTFSGHLLFTM